MVALRAYGLESTRNNNVMKGSLHDHDRETAPDVVGKPYLEGYLAPVDTEITVEAADPGHRLHPRPPRRPVPAQRFQPGGQGEPAIQHWFLGDAMVHGLALRDGKAQWYRNRLVHPGGVAGAGRTTGAGLDPQGRHVGRRTQHQCADPRRARRWRWSRAVARSTG